MHPFPMQTRPQPTWYEKVRIFYLMIKQLVDGYISMHIFRKKGNLDHQKET